MPARIDAARSTDHPRGGGEHKVWKISRSLSDGSSPRGRGTRQARKAEGCLARIIPAGRGTLEEVPIQSLPFRIIPAGAGNTSHKTRQAPLPADHPRGGGEHFQAEVMAGFRIPSSPRGRGTLSSRSHGRVSDSIIPAWAGNTRTGVSMRRWMTDHPRGGGEHLPIDRIPAHACGSSPRGRGTHCRSSFKCRIRRIIPAWAGNTPHN